MSYVDEFGDYSFMIDLNVDAIIAARRDSTTHVSTGPRPFDEKGSTPSNKRLKLSTVNVTDESLRQCLQRYFGFSQFRDGQLKVLQAALQGHDVAVFWSTGSGKSIAYTLPALYSQRTSLVISPLISLMQDQVHKLNHLGFGELATYLGSAQHDATMERRALQGEFRLIFCTPEKLQSNHFLEGLGDLPLCLIAVDEAHCVSGWGHDFRPKYRQAGETIRSHPKLCQIPIMALTATALPRIQQDIIETLHMSNVVKCFKSFDRTNLAIKVIPNEGVRSAMEPLVQALSKNPTASTIVYCPTRAQVEQVASFLQHRFQACRSMVQVDYYHADLPTARRQEAHLRFLTGQTSVIVATIAFGMGIDKPDIRRVIHYGPPKTVEEYYQQIGRAGRDGLPADCLMYCSASDFDRYHSDFYLKNLNAKARQATIQSTEALKNFAMNRDKCRRKLILEFFEEVPKFGDWCGICDVCVNRKMSGNDATRDFGKIVRFILHGVNSLAEQGLTVLLQVLSGNVVESDRYKRHINPVALQVTLQEERKSLGKHITNDQLKEFSAELARKKYISEVLKPRGNSNGYSRPVTVFGVTPMGDQVLRNRDQPILLPVPESIREMERQADIHLQRVVQQLEDLGLDVSKLPQKEVEDGDGEVIQAYLKWNRRLEALEKTDKIERLQQVQELLQIIQRWRSHAASELKMAPASILAEHLVFAIAYTAQSLPGGMNLSVADLEQTGARNRLIPSLVSDINGWLAKYPPSTSIHTTSTLDENDLVLIFPAGPVQGTKWPYSTYRPIKTTGLAFWESSYLRFSKGESPMSIAMAPASGKPLAVLTVIGHIQEALVQGRPVDLQRLASFMSDVPTTSQWFRLEEAEIEMEVSVVGDPATSGVQGGKYIMTDMLQPIMGKEFAAKPYDQRTEDERQSFNAWYQALKWYQLLKRAGITPQFGTATSREQGYR